MTNFLQAARHTDKDEHLPHQDAAWAYAWDCLTVEERAEFLSIFRAAVPSKAGDVSNTWQGVAQAALDAGSRYPELCAAQWALESAWGKAPSGRNNHWGLKGKGTKRVTKEVVDGRLVEVVAEFQDFPSIRAGVQFLVDRWYKDFAHAGKTYQGVNRAPDRESAAEELVKQGYATDPSYAAKLIDLMREQDPRPQPTQAVVKAEVEVWRTKIAALNLSQPDASTCQAACIGMAVGDRDVAGIRQKLRRKGTAGDPNVMAAMIRESYPRTDYAYEGNASLSQVVAWLKAGELLVTHGWFTRSGHVIVLDGAMKRPSGDWMLDVKDPWSEFNAAAWGYTLGSRFFDGYYSAGLIYATCVAGQSLADARAIYQRRELDLKRTGMWVHRFKVS
jgi:hypothetical protein